MYRKLFIILFVVTMFLGSAVGNRVYALNPKVKVLVSTGSYGMIGGTLLGTATLAFGTSGRAVAQGASIGLWTGLLFGSYIILSHMIHLSPATDQDAPYGGDSPYGDAAYGEPDAGGGNESVEVDGAGNPLERWNPYAELRQYEQERDWASRIQKSRTPLLYINVLQVSF